MGCFSGCLMSSAGIQKLFCGIYSTFKCSFDEFVGRKCFPRPTPPPSWRLPPALSFLIVQISCPYVTTGKTIALIRRTFVGKVMSLFFNMPSRLVIDFLPRSKRLLISWLQSPSVVILEPRKIKSVTVCTVSLSICYEAMGPHAVTLFFER